MPAADSLQQNALKFACCLNYQISLRKVGSNCGERIKLSFINMLIFSPYQILITTCVISHFFPHRSCISIGLQIILGCFRTQIFMTYPQEIWANAHEMRESLWQFLFSSLAENWSVHAKLIYKYQILYLDHIMIVPWRHLLNDTDLCRSPKSPKKSTKTPILAFKVIQGHWIQRQSRASVRLPISD